MLYMSDNECKEISDALQTTLRKRGEEISSIILDRDERGLIYHAKPIYETDLKISVEDFFEIKKIIFNDPATIIFWKDGTKTVVKCQPGDKYDKEKGLAMCYMKKAMGNKGNFNDQFNMLIDSNYKTKRRRAKKEAKRAAKN